MSKSTSSIAPQRDSAAECHARASADRARAAEMDTANGRRKFEQSATSWDVRGALLERLEASFNKRKELDNESARYSAARGGICPELLSRPINWEGTAALVAPMAGRSQ